MDNIISEERAQEILDQFMEYYDIDPGTMPDNLQTVLESSFAKMKRAIRDGRLDISFSEETITIIQKLVKPINDLHEIVYKEITGNAKIGIKENASDYGKMYGFLGALSGDGLTVIQRLKGKDLSLAEALGCVFLQV